MFNEPKYNSIEKGVSRVTEEREESSELGTPAANSATMRGSRTHVFVRNQPVRAQGASHPNWMCAIWLLSSALLLSGCYTVNSFVDAPDANPGDGICARAHTPREIVSGAFPFSSLPLEQRELLGAVWTRLNSDDLSRIESGDLSPVQRPQMAKDLAVARERVRTIPSLEPIPPGDLTSGPPRLCTLRAAIMEANAHPWKSVITVPPGTYKLTVPFNQGGGPLSIERNMRIQGSGAANTVVDGQESTTVFYINAPLATSIEINNLTVRKGDSQAGGGLYINQGTIELEDLIVRDNFGFTGGGGLLVNEDATVYVRRAAFTDNQGQGAFGGAIWNVGDLWVYDSTFSGNDSNRAGAIHNSGNLNLRNVTVSGNSAHSPEAGVGGIRQWGFAVLNNVTITNNEGIGNQSGFDQGGGIQTIAGATTVMKNSIIAGNNGNGGPNDCVGTLSGDSQYNLIADTDGCTITSHLNTYVLDQTADLGILASNGGPTLSHMPNFSSPARDAAYGFPPPAINACEARDQRGVPRPQGEGGCDMGAVEYSGNFVSVSGFMLVNAATNTDIRPLLNDDWLILSQLPPQLSVRAVTSGVAGSVVFEFDGNPGYRTENAAPYLLGGDAGGDYAPIVLTGGQHVLTATPFAAADGNGQAGPGRSIFFNVLRMD